MIFGVFGLYFSLLELMDLTCERLNFKTLLKIEFLWPFTGQRKVLENTREWCHLVLHHCLQKCD